MTEPETDPFQIRPAINADKQALEAFLQPFIADRKILPRTTHELDMLVFNGFVAECGGRVVGFAALEVYSPKLAEIRSLAVDGAMRGRGVGKKLVEFCVNRAHERGVLEVMAISSAEDFFLSCGFNFTLPDEKKAFFVKTRDT